VCLIPTVAGTIANAMASKHGEFLVPEIIKAHKCIGSLFYEQYCKQQIYFFIFQKSLSSLTFSNTSLPSKYQ
jgi:hypothetical protein